ncbi:MAG: hypothetical protein IJ759_00115 [Bacteroidales bacterium]|nr:hypothetical protein [Bacteroidales bacterium]
MKVYKEIDIQDVYDELSWNKQKEFLLENLDDLSEHEILNNIDSEEILSYMKNRGYLLVEE